MNNQCAIRKMEESYLLNYNFSEKYGWLARKIFASHEEAEQWVKEKGLTVIEDEE